MSGRNSWMTRCRMAVILFLVAATFTSNGPHLSADEPYEDFLRALRSHRYFDVALEYLDDMQDSELANESFRRRVPLLKVAILLDEAATIRDAERVTRQLDMTEQILDEFIASNPDADLLAEAQEQRANISMGRAQRLLDRASSDRITVQQRTEFQGKAREYLNEAGETFESIRLRLRSELENYKIDPQDPDANKRLERLRNDYIKIRLKSPRVKEQIADSFGPQDPQYKELLQAASEEYLELFDKYRTRLSGIDGCLGAARCFQKIGDSTKSLGYLLEVFDLPLGQIQNLKKREAALVALDAWATVDPYPAQEAFARLQPVIYSMPPDFARTADGIRLRMEFAKICNMLADMIRDQGASSAEERRQMTLLERESTNIMRALSRVSGPHRDEARQLLKEWGNAVAAGDTGDDADAGPPETMNDARQRGTDIQLAVAEVKSALKEKEKELAEAAGTPRESTLQDDVEELRTQLNARSAQALTYFEMALTMAGDDAAADDLANLRYLQAASYFQMDRFFETAIIGEFLAERFPDNSGTRPAVGLVCKAYWQMYLQSKQETDADSAAQDTRFELQQLKKYSELVFKKWPGTEQAETSGILMTLVSLDQNDPLAADRYLEKIPAQSPTRAAVVLEVGNKLWRQFVLDQRQGNEDPKVRAQAQKLLENGISFLKIENVTPYHARSALSLTELYLDSGQNDAALNQLELAPVAPLDLVKNKHPAAQDPQYRRDTFKTAIRTYLAKLRDADDPLAWVEKSKGVLQALRQDIGEQPEGKKQLTGIYLTLSRELKQQFDSLETNDQRVAFADGLESFLQALADNAEDRQLMLLTGTMLTDIGSSLKQNDLVSQADRFFEMAVKVYSSLGEAQDPDPRIQLAIDRGRANSLRGSGRYEEAIKLFGDILEDPDNQRYRDIQVDAALTLAEWGLSKNDPVALVSAVNGGEKRAGTKTIMGWIQLAKVARREKNTVLFAECVYYIAQCKFRYGKIKQQREMQESAIGEIEKFRTNVPEMGGPQWKARLQQLHQQLKSEVSNP